MRSSVDMPSQTTNLAQIVLDMADRYPQHTALLYRDTTYTYAELADELERLAGALEQLGLRAGDRVALLLYNTPAFVLGYFALLSLGVTVIPLNTRLTAPEISTILNDAQARLLMTSVEFAEVVSRVQVSSLKGILVDTELLDDDATLDRLLHQIPAGCALYRLDDFLARNIYPEPELPRSVSATTLATLIYTSGTTGTPKGVMLSHRNIEADAQANAQVIDATADDRFITVSPLFHVFGQTNILMTAMLSGASVVLVRKFSPRAILEAIERYQVTFMAAVPTMYLMMLSYLREHPFDLSSLRVCHSGAAPMAVETFHDVEAHFGAPVQEGYGLSEASSIVCSNPLRGVRKPGSVGLPLPGVEVEVRLDDAQVAPPGTVGELHVRGEIVMQGYYGRPDETRIVLLADGWLRTRDLAHRDADGYVYIVDRVDDLINIGGVKVYPREIEEVFYRHPAVHAVAVTGLPSSLHHELIKAFVVLKPGVSCSKDELIAFCQPYLAEYKIPRQYEFVAEIPQGATGKILRKQLRERG